MPKLDDVIGKIAIRNDGKIIIRSTPEAIDMVKGMISMNKPLFTGFTTPERAPVSLSADGVDGNTKFITVESAGEDGDLGNMCRFLETEAGKRLKATGEAINLAPALLSGAITAAIMQTKEMHH